jgi:hypothetical protein
MASTKHISRALILDILIHNNYNIFILTYIALHKISKIINATMLFTTFMF